MESIHKLSKPDSEEMKKIVKKVNKRIKKEKLDAVNRELEKIESKRVAGHEYSFAWQHKKYKKNNSKVYDENSTPIEKGLWKFSLVK